jgi:hypothetical protein
MEVFCGGSTFIGSERGMVMGVVWIGKTSFSGSRISSISSSGNSSKIPV